MKHRVSNLHPGSQTVARLAGFALAVSLLSGCAVQDLKAPLQPRRRSSPALGIFVSRRTGSGTGFFCN